MTAANPTVNEHVHFDEQGAFVVPCLSCKKREERIRALEAELAELSEALRGKWLPWKARADEAEAERDALKARVRELEAGR